MSPIKPVAAPKASPPELPAFTLPKAVMAQANSTVQCFCPYCSIALNVDARVAGQETQCPNCHARFMMPIRQAALPGQSTPGPSKHSELPGGIFVCLLISGIANILVGLIWVSTCFLSPIGLAQIVLAIFELITATGLGNMNQQTALSRVRVLGICEIVSGLFNWISLVCGILNVVYSNQRTAR